MNWVMKDTKTISEQMNGDFEINPKVM